MKHDAVTSNIDRAFVSIPLCTALQMALVDLMFSWNIHPRIVVGHSTGEIAAAYCAGILSLESAMTVAYYGGKLSSQLEEKDFPSRGAMLGAGLSAAEAQTQIEEVKVGKATIACINSPQCVTISGDKDAVDELHLKLERKGTLSLKLKIGVAYHSEHILAIADDYSRALRTLDVRAGKREMEFCSSVCPGISVERDGEYWVQNLLSLVRFSDAMNIVLADQPNRESRIDACIEIGPQAGLAWPFEQICQEMPAEDQPVYLPSILEGQDGVESLLATACELFKNGWKVDVAALNFPDGGNEHRILTDLPF